MTRPKLKNTKGQVTVNGIVPGESWRTTNVKGTCECMHTWGRTILVKVKDVWVNVNGDTLTMGATFNDPVIDSKVRSGFFFPTMRGKLSTEFPTEIQTIIETPMTGIGDDEEFRTIRSAMIVMEDGEPKAVAFTETTCAMFDIPKFLRKIEKAGDTFGMPIDYLKGFDDLGFRTVSFEAKF